MNIFLWEIKEFISDVACGVGNVFLNIGRGIIDFFVITFGTIRVIVYKIMCVVLAITTICFMIGLFLLFLNVREMMNGVGFIDTKYFYPMLYLCGAHILTFVICKVLRPKY